MNHTGSAGLIMVGLLAAVMTTGCNRSISALETRSPPQPLTPAPLEPVQSAELAPPGSDPALIAQDPTLEQQTQTASVDPALSEPVDGAPTPLGQPEPQTASASGPPLTREALAGTWIVNTDNPECRIILAFTKWSGGYRAATRRCDSAELTAITAWDVKENRVVLVDGNGTNVASLYSTGIESYEGSTIGGAQVTLSR